MPDSIGVFLTVQSTHYRCSGEVCPSNLVRMHVFVALYKRLRIFYVVFRMLQKSSVDGEKDGGPQFAEVFVVVWFGAVTITLNSKLLGGNM